MKAVGVPEFAAYLAGEASLEQALARAQQAARRYAKRQMTWLRHQFIGNDQPVLIMETQYSESQQQDFFAKIRRKLLTYPGSRVLCPAFRHAWQIGRAWWRDRVCQY